MRYPAEKIKDAILHPDIEIRDRAVSYFARAYSDDVSLMAQVIRAVEMYGRQDAYRLIGDARDLRQTDESIAWVVGELNDESSDQFENYTSNLSEVLAKADPALLLPREGAILEARHLWPELRPSLVERLRMHSWDEATCWRELEAFCEAAVREHSADEVNVNLGRRIVEALARHGRQDEGRILDLLGQKVAEDDTSPMLWMEPLVVRLAGLIRLEAAIPSIVAKLLADGSDVLNEECAEALTRIGTPAVVHAIAEAYPGAEDHFRLYSTGSLENIHSDLAVETCLRLLGQETDERQRQRLADALLTQFASEGIEAARRLLVGRELDFEGRGLRGYLLETCALTGERFPEYDEWLAASQAETEAHRKRVEEIGDDPRRLLLYALERITGEKAADVARAAPRRLPIAPPAPPRRVEGRRKVGRNEPCPCGSGKKFKKCCGRQ